jgi:plasmid stabilization system protein ParE
MAFHVDFTDEAEACADEIYRWIAERSPDGAVRWKRALERTVERIADAADTFALAPESDAFREPVREIPFKTRKGRKYRALFVIRDDVATIISVRGAGQDLISPDDVPLPD